MRVAQHVPTEVAFLVHYGMASAVLMAAAATARAQRITADAVLFAQRPVHMLDHLAQIAKTGLQRGNLAGDSGPSFFQSGKSVFV